MIRKEIAILLCGLYGVVAIAQQSGANDPKASADAAWVRAGCGSDSIHFDVKLDKKQHPTPQPDAGKAVVYVFEDDQTRGSFPTTRVGVDGKWMGANLPESYFFFSVDPGAHHLCSNWQGSKIGDALDFTAQAGKTYYFRARIKSMFGNAFELEQLSNAEGQVFLATHSLSISEQKANMPFVPDSN